MHIYIYMDTYTYKHTHTFERVSIGVMCVSVSTCVLEFVNSNKEL